MTLLRRLFLAAALALLAAAPAAAQLEVNQLSGFGAGGKIATGAEVDRTLGSAFGDMVDGGGNAAAFDGVTDQANTAGARKNAATTAYVGRTGDTARIISKATVHGSNNQGYHNSANPSITVSLYAKTGSAPSSGTDGTLLGSITFTDTTNESVGRDITSSDASSEWDHWWLYVTHDGASAAILVAEARFFE